MPTTRSTRSHTFAAVGALGLLILVIGTFLPWFRSGSASRTSYEAVSVADRFGLFDNALVSTALRGWVAVPLLAACALGFYLLRFRRVGAALTVVLSAGAGTIGVITVVQAGGIEGVVQATAIGPLVTTAGTILAVTGALGVLVAAASTTRQPAGRAGVYS